MSFKDHIIANPKSYLATMLTVLSLISMSWAAADLFIQKNAWATDISDLKGLMRVQNRTRLEDKIFQLEFKNNEGTASSLDKAELNRYKSRLIKLDTGSVK